MCRSVLYEYDDGAHKYVARASKSIFLSGFGLGLALGALALAESLDPAFPPLIGLGIERERSWCHVVADGRPRRDVGIVADRDRRDELAVSALLHAVPDRRAVLGEAVVVAGNGAGADVRLAT